MKDYRNQQIKLLHYRENQQNTQLKTSEEAVSSPSPDKHSHKIEALIPIRK